MNNQDFNKDFKSFITDFLTEKGKEIEADQKRRIRNAGIRRTGKLEQSPQYKVTTDTSTGIHRLKVSQRFYGRIINKKTISGIGKKGNSSGKATPPESLKQWIKEVGIQNFAGKKSGSQARILNNIAWGISKKWKKDKKRKGKPWGYNEIKNYLDEGINNEMLEAYEDFIQRNIT